MPCYDGRDSYTRTVPHEAIVFDSSADFEEAVLRRSVATPLLCEAMEIIKKNNLIHKCSKALVEWGAKHEKDDLERVQKIYDMAKEKQRELDAIYANMDDRDIELIKVLITRDQNDDSTHPSNTDNILGGTNLDWLSI
jgi:hypothetical protein